MLRRVSVVVRLFYNLYILCHYETVYSVDMCLRIDSIFVFLFSLSDEFWFQLLFKKMHFSHFPQRDVMQNVCNQVWKEYITLHIQKKADVLQYLNSVEVIQILEKECLQLPFAYDWMYILVYINCFPGADYEIRRTPASQEPLFFLDKALFLFFISGLSRRAAWRHVIPPGFLCSRVLFLNFFRCSETCIHVFRGNEKV